MAFPTSYIKTEGSTVTRPATILEFPSVGILRGNDIAIQGVVTSAGTEGVSSSVALASSYIDSSNWFSIYSADSHTNLRIGGLTDGSVHTADIPCNFEVGTPFQYQVYADGLKWGIRLRNWDGLTWSAWSAWGETTTSDDLSVADLLQIGSRDDIQQFNGNIPVFQTRFISDPKAYLEANAIY